MLEIRPFRAVDAHRLIATLQPMQRSENVHAHDVWPAVERAAVQGVAPAFTGFRQSDGVLLGAAGLKPCWHGRAEVWAMLSRAVGGADMIGIHRAILAFIERQQALPGGRFRRLETTVLNCWPRAHRWARMLGFQQEGVARKFDIEGNDYAIYARIAQAHAKEPGGPGAEDEETQARQTALAHAPQAAGVDGVRAPGRSAGADDSPHRFVVRRVGGRQRPADCLEDLLHHG